MNQLLSANDSHILVVAADPGPIQVWSSFNRNSSVGTPNPYNPVIVDLLEVKRRVPRVVPEQLEVSPRGSLNCFG